jgi:hypothetical protein
MVTSVDGYVDLDFGFFFERISSSTGFPPKCFPKFGVCLIPNSYIPAIRFMMPQPQTTSPNENEILNPATCEMAKQSIKFTGEKCLII